MICVNEWSEWWSTSTSTSNIRSAVVTSGCWDYIDRHLTCSVTRMCMSMVLFQDVILTHHTCITPYVYIDLFYQKTIHTARQPYVNTNTVHQTVL